MTFFFIVLFYCAVYCAGFFGRYFCPIHQRLAILRVYVMLLIDVSRVVRDIQDAELHKFFSRIVKLTQGRDLGHETIDSLQRLHLILSASQSTRL